MIPLGTVKPGSTHYIPFESFAGSTGANITLSGLATSDILIYKNGGTGQRASASGITLLDTDGTDFDGITGIHGFSIDLADNTTAGFYTSGASYWVIVSTVTVDSQTVSFIAATFTIGYAGALLDTTIATLSSQTNFTLTEGPAEDDALNDRYLLLHDVASGVQVATGLILDYTGSTKAVTLAAAPTFTIAAGDNASVMGLAPLQPTVLGRRADVSAGGEVGIDWANVGSPTTAVNLSSTSIGTATALGAQAEADVEASANAALINYDSQNGVAYQSSLLDITLNLGAVLNRLGDFAGTGVNTVKGFFRALMRKDATLPSEIEGTYAVATDSLEAQAEAQAALGITIAALPDAAGIVTALKADSEWQAILAGVKGEWECDPPDTFPGEGTFTLLSEDGLTTIAEFTLSFNADGVVTTRIPA